MATTWGYVFYKRYLWLGGGEKDLHKAWAKAPEDLGSFPIITNVDEP